MRDLNELHKTSPSAQADSKTGAAAASPLPVPANHSVSQAFNVAENATTRSEGEIDNAEAENTTHARPAELSPKRTKQGNLSTMLLCMQSIFAADLRVGLVLPISFLPARSQYWPLASMHYSADGIKL